MNNIYLTKSPYRSGFQRSTIQKPKPRSASAELIKFDISPYFIMGFLMVTAMVLGLLYLINFNQMATKGYELKRLEISRQELKGQYDLTNLYVAKVKSLDHILQSNRLGPMRKPESVNFVYADSVLAKAD